MDDARSSAENFDRETWLLVIKNRAVVDMADAGNRHIDNKSMHSHYMLYVQISLASI